MPDADRMADKAISHLHRATQPNNPHREYEYRRALQLLEPIREEIDCDE